MKTEQDLLIEDKQVSITSLDKPLWTEPLVTKGDLLQYYIKIAPIALKYWQNRPLTLTRYPNGVDEEGFYQKNCPKYAPDWIKTVSVTGQEGIEYIICNDLATLVWLGNQGTIEIHPATYEITQEQTPSYAIIDLDPTPPLGFPAAREVAKKVKIVLDQLGLRGYPKTSGATGIHIYIPLQPRYSFFDTSRLVEFIGKLLIEFYPEAVTNERLIKNRHGVYIDHLQNQAKKTIVGPYSLRPLEFAPISTPIEWDELGTVSPNQFTILNFMERIAVKGDLFASVLTDLQSIDHLLAML